MKKRSLIFLIVLVICLVMVCILPVIAKYVKEKSSEVNITSDNFYFTVDLLGDTNTEASLKKTYSFYGGDTKEVTFNIQNYFDEFRITSSDVKYNVSYEVKLPTGSLYDVSNVSVNVNGTGTLSKGGKSFDECTLRALEGYDNGTEIVISISSTAPYKKTMVITFILMTFESEGNYYIIDSKDSLYAELFITTNVPIPVGALIIDFSDINNSSNLLQVDMTNIYLIDEANVLNQIEPGESYLKCVTNTIAINTGEAISIKFFKKDISKDYSLASTKLNGVVEGIEKVYKIILTNNE